jgi:hypothetical protein
MTPGRWLAVAVAALLGAGCGSDAPHPFDPATLEGAIAVSLLPDHPEMIDGVTCPEIGESRITRCAVVIAGAEVQVVVDGPSDDRHVSVVTGIDLVWADDVAAVAAERLDADLGVVNDVVCGPVLRVAAAGQRFDCVATDPDGGDHRFVAEVLDRHGAFRLDLVPGG